MADIYHHLRRGFIEGFLLSNFKVAKVGKLYVKMKLLTSHFQKKSIFKVTRGHKQRKKVKKLKFRTRLKVVKLCVKISFRRHIFQKSLSRGHSRSSEVKNRLNRSNRNFVKSMQIICQKEALDVSFSKLIVSRSINAIKGQN